MSVTTGPDSQKDLAFTALVQRHQTGLRRMCYAMLRDAEQAKDAVQETFVKAYRAMDDWRGACSEKTWLTRIAVNTCRDMRRSAWFRRIDRRVTLEDLPVAAGSADQESRELTIAILALPEKLREVTLLYYYQDMTLRETGEALGLSPSAVKKRLVRARDRLRDALEGRQTHE